MPTATQRAHAAAAPLAIRISGRLLCDAVVRYTVGAEPRALLVAELDGAHGLPIVAQQDLGTSPTAHMAAHSKCASLRQHARVTAFGESISLWVRNGAPALRLNFCSDLIPETYITRLTRGQD
ncbi:MAG: hypothetical protein LW854_08750 [Rubrivivax sp.]|jgi:hypothetical protein|nr:hypothetical protein [Rubrivivax sp.]